MNVLVNAQKNHIVSRCHAYCSILFCIEECQAVCNYFCIAECGENCGIEWCGRRMT